MLEILKSKWSTVLIAAVMGFGAITLLANVLLRSAYEKTEPYKVSINLSSPKSGSIQVAYDYGLGQRADHIQSVPIVEGNNNIDVTISAWKELQSLEINSGLAEQVSVITIFVNKGEATLASYPHQEGTLKTIEFTNHQQLPKVFHF